MKKIYLLLLMAVLGVVSSHAAATYQLTFTGSNLLTITYKGEVQTIEDGVQYTYVLNDYTETVVITPKTENVQFTVYNPEYQYGSSYSSEYSFSGYEYSDYTETYEITAVELQEQTLTLSTDVTGKFTWCIYDRYNYTGITDPVDMTSETTAVNYYAKYGYTLKISPVDGNKFYSVTADGEEIEYSSYNGCYYVDLTTNPQNVVVTTAFPEGFTYTATFSYYNFVNYTEVPIDANDVITQVMVDDQVVEMTDNTVSVEPGKSLKIRINTDKYKPKWVISSDWYYYNPDSSDESLIVIGALSSDQTYKVLVQEKVETVEKTLTLTTDATGKFTYKFYNGDEYTNTTEPVSMDTESVTLTYQYPVQGEELVITPNDGNKFYKVIVNDNYVVTPYANYSYETGGYTYVYYIAVDSSSEESYGGPVEKVQVVTIVPDDATYNLSFTYYNSKTYETFEADDVINKVLINDVESSLNTDGTLTVPAGANVKIGINTELYAFSRMTSNDGTFSLTSLTDGMADLGAISSDMGYTIYVKESVPVNFTLTLNCDPSLVVFYLNYETPVEGLVQGDNPMTLEDGTYISVKPVNSELTSITFDGVEQLYSTPYSYTWYGTVSAGLQNMTIDATAINRDIPFTYYINQQPSDIGEDLGYIYYEFYNAYSYVVTPVNGYNTIYTRDEDGSFRISVSVYSEGAFSHKAYYNGEEATYNYLYEFMPDTDDVIKLFLYTEEEGAPAIYDVTFITEGEVGDVAIKQDISKTVDLAAGTASAVGYTEWNITTECEVLVDGVTVPADENNVHTFSTTQAATVTLIAPAGVDGIRLPGVTNGPVYNTQGIIVLEDVTKGMDKLPAGIYIVGGKKVVIR